MKDYVGKKQSEKLLISETEQKLTTSLSEVPWSCSIDGLLHFGSKVMLHSKKTNGYLVLDIGTRLPTVDEAYAVTTTGKPVGPMARSIFLISKGDDNDKSKDDIVHYGQKIRFQSNAHIFPKPVTLIANETI